MAEDPPTYDELRSRFGQAETQRAACALSEASGHNEADSLLILGYLARAGWRLVKLPNDLPA